MAIDMLDSMPASGGFGNSAQRVDDLLYENHNIVNASDLYAYHILPSIMSDLEAMGVSIDLQYHADIQAEMRWNFLDAQQQAYWYKRIKRYRHGNLVPLNESTYQQFCDKRMLLQDGANSGTDDIQDAPEVLATPFGFLRPAAVASANEDQHRKSLTAATQVMTGLTENSQDIEVLGKERRNGVSSKGAGEFQAKAAPSLSLEAVQKLEAALQEAAPRAKVDTLPCRTRDINICQAPPITAQALPTPTRKTKKQKPIRARGFQENNHDNAIVHLLGGHVMRMQIPDFTTGISAIVRSIGMRLHRDAGLTLQGRCRSKRVDFDPRARGVTSISERLLQAVARGEWIDLDDRKLWTPKATIGFMLRFFVDWNRFSHAFQDCQPTRVKPKGALKCANEYASRWTWLECLAGVIGPITHARRHDVVAVIMQLLRSRAEKLCPAALTTGVYGLLENDRSFARMLLGCFSYQNLSHEEYQDLMEQKMFRLNRKHPRLGLTQR